MKDFIQVASARQISKIWIFTHEIVYYWGLKSLEEIFQTIDIFIPEIYEFVDIAKMKKRSYEIKKNRLVEKSVSNILPLGFNSFYIEDTIPEMVTIRNEFRKAFVSVSSGIEKTEAWLYPYALKAEADANLEALIYFKSKGESLISSNKLSEIWRKSLCKLVESYDFLHRNNDVIINKAKKKELSLVELAQIYKNTNYYFFQRTREVESDFIFSTFFRAVEWFELHEFEPWINVYTQDVSRVFHSKIDHEYSLLTRLFYFCRSDLLIRKTKFSLEALLHILCVGYIDDSKPWKIIRDKDTIVDYLPYASMLVFAWHRIKPTNINNEIFNQALLLLLQTQLVSGAWPLTLNDKEESIFSTYLAMTALSVTKPNGYQRYVNNAKKWLLSQQNEVGCWYIEGGPSVMINILCLEAIKLSEGSNLVTYNLQENTSNIKSNATIKDKQNIEEIKKYIHEFIRKNIYELNSLHKVFLAWLDTKEYETVNSDLLEDLKKNVSIIITTVTNIETYMLHNSLMPIQGFNKIIRLFKNDNTYYIGKFGNYNIVNVVSGMGSYTVGGSADVLKNAIVHWEPKLIISLGIAFGIDIKKQKLGDVLISSTIIPYDKNSKIENGILILRDPWFPQISTFLKDRIRNLAYFRNKRFRTHFGCIITGENLIDDPNFKEMILDATNTYNIIGGEMEAYGVFKTASENQIRHCLTIKGVCDWAEGKNALSDDQDENTNIKEKLQLFAASNAVYVCKKFFSEDYAFTDIGIKSENEKCIKSV